MSLTSMAIWYTNPIYTSEVVFSNTSQKGLNPLKINRHPDYGGVKRRIKTFINMLERYSVSLGIQTGQRFKGAAHRPL